MITKDRLFAAVVGMLLGGLVVLVFGRSIYQVHEVNHAMVRVNTLTGTTWIYRNDGKWIRVGDGQEQNQVPNASEQELIKKYAQ